MGEGYGQGFNYDENSTSGIQQYKDIYNHPSYATEKLPPNWDIAGSPKWCSGKVNVNSGCYKDYNDLNQCLLSSNTNNDKKAADCVIAFTDAIGRKGFKDIPPSCNLGTQCVDDSNSWFIGNGYYRAYKSDLMDSSNDNESINKKMSYGPSGDKQIEETIKLLTRWNNEKNSIKKVNLKVLKSYIHQNTNSYDVYVKFKISDVKNNSLSIFTDDILDNIFSVKYKMPNETEYRNIGILKKDTDGNYFVNFTNWISEKELPPTALDFRFDVKFPKFTTNINVLVQ